MDENRNIDFNLRIFGINDLKLLQSEIKKINVELNTFGKNTGINIDTKQSISNLSNLKRTIADLPKQLSNGITGNNYSNYFNDLSRQSKETNNVFDKLGKTMKHHLLFGASGLMLGGMIGIPVAIANIAKETEALTNKLRQNLELADQYHHNNELLESDLKRLNDIGAIYAVGFGESLTTVLDSMQLLARRFKDVEQVSYLTSVALTMAKIDNVNLMVATQNLESVMLQFQLDLDGTRNFLNAYTTACHVAKVNGTELLEMLSRSAASFKQFNMSIEESLAALATLATESGRTAGVVGNSFKSITANFSMDKAIAALDAYGVKLYDTNEEGLKIMRKGSNVFRELMTVFSTLDAEGQQKLAMSTAGGKYQINQMLLFLQNAGDTYGKILEDIKTKSSDALTAQLFKLGLDTFQIKLMQLQASMQVFSKTIGDEVLPSLKDITDGLTNGVIWLTENKEAVGKATSALVEFAKVVTAYYIQQGIANLAIKEGTTLLRLMYLLEGNFSTAFAGMGVSLKNFGMIAASVTLQMAALYAAINVIQAAYSRFSDKSGLTGQQQDLSQQLSMIEGNRQYALANSKRTGLSKDEINKIYDSQIAELKSKLESVNSAKKEQENAATNKALEESERAFKAIIDRAMASAELKKPTRPNAITNNKVNKSTNGRMPSDKSNELFKLDARHNVNHMLKMASIDADEFTNKLELLNTQQEIFGVTTETTAEKLNLMHSRISSLLGSAFEYNDLANSYEDQANDIVVASGIMTEALEKQKLSFKTLTLEERKDFAERYKDYVSDYKLLINLLELSDKLRVSAADAGKQANKLGVNSVKTELGDMRSLFNSRSRMIGYNQQIEILALNRFAPDETKKVIELKYAVQQLALEKERLREIESHPHSEEDLLRQQAAVDTLKAKVKDLGDTWQGVRQGLSNITTDLLVNGNSWREIWNNLWADLAREAIQRIFQVQVQASLLGSIFSSFGGGGVTSTMPPVPPKIGFNAMGSIGSQQQLSWIREGNKKEAIIPLEDHKERGQQLWLQSGIELGMISKGVSYVPYLKNPEIAQQAIESRTPQSNELVNELKKSNTLLIQQNQLLLSILNKGLSNNGTTIAQPIVMRQDMSEDELAGKIAKMRASGYSV